MKSFLITIFSIIQMGACSNTPKKNTPIQLPDPVQTQREDGYKNAYFGSGCFWCVEAIFESVKGVKEAISGYAGGTTKNPTYRQVGSGNTGHAEVIEVIYNPNKINFETLLKVYYGSQNPTTYGIFYQNNDEKLLIENYKAKVQESYKEEKVKTEILPFQVFWKAEDYHQNFERLNPDYPYIVRVSKPRLERFKEKFPKLIKH